MDAVRRHRDRETDATPTEQLPKLSSRRHDAPTKVLVDRVCQDVSFVEPSCRALQVDHPCPRHVHGYRRLVAETVSVRREVPFHFGTFSLPGEASS
jgi:hypothetical protein